MIATLIANVGQRFTVADVMRGRFEKVVRTERVEALPIDVVAAIGQAGYELIR